MGYPTKIQLIKREKGADQWYINFPAALAGAMDFERGETVEWSIQDRSTLVLTRPSAERIPLKKKQKELSSGSSKSSSGRQGDSLDRKGSSKRQGR